VSPGLQSLIVKSNVASRMTFGALRNMSPVINHKLLIRSAAIRGHINKAMHHCPIHHDSSTLSIAFTKRKTLIATFRTSLLVRDYVLGWSDGSGYTPGIASAVWLGRYCSRKTARHSNLLSIFVKRTWGKPVLLNVTRLYYRFRRL